MHFQERNGYIELTVLWWDAQTGSHIDQRSEQTSKLMLEIWRECCMSLSGEMSCCPYQCFLFLSIKLRLAIVLFQWNE